MKTQFLAQFSSLWSKVKTSNFLNVKKLWFYFVVYEEWGAGPFSVLRNVLKLELEVELFDPRLLTRSCCLN